MGEAVRQCVEAAGHEHEAETQKTLLRVSHESFRALYLELINYFKGAHKVSVLMTKGLDEVKEKPEEDYLFWQQDCMMLNMHKPLVDN